MAAEKAAEIERVIISHRSGDLAYVISSAFKEILGVCHAQGEDVLHRSYLEYLAEAPDKPTHAQMA